MNSRDRVLAVFNHQEPDRVPINLIGTNEGINKRLKKHLGLNLNDDEGLMQVLHIDFRRINVPYIGPKLFSDKPNRVIDPLWGTHMRWVENEAGGYWDYCDFPLENATMDDVLKWPLPSPDDFDYEAVKSLCAENKEYFLVWGNPGFGCIINSNGMLRTMEQAFIDLARDDEVGLTLAQRRMDVQREVMVRTLEAAKGRIDMAWIGEDLGSQTAPLISVEMFRKYIRPNLQMFVDAADSFNVPLMVHCCGSSSWAFDDFIEMGIKVVDTLQPEAVNMAPKYLKQRFGDKLNFHGCISTAGPMANGTVQDTIEDVKQILDIMMPGGGYAMAPTHAIQDNSPVENVLAAFETAYNYGIY